MQDSERLALCGERLADRPDPDRLGDVRAEGLLIRPDHVHLLLSVPPHLAPSRVMQAIKGKTSHHLLMDHRRLREAFWGRHLWARGYFVASSGNVTDEVIAQYIKLQGAEPEDDDRFRITEKPSLHTRRWRLFSRLQSRLSPRLQATPSGGLR